MNHYYRYHAHVYVLGRMPHKLSQQLLSEQDL